VLLIGGTAAVGKSTVARLLAARLGAGLESTDRLGRHPGRPWTIEERPVPDHVVEHYRRLSTEELAAEQLAHYERMWPGIHALIEQHARDATAFVLEGSGIWPDRCAGLTTPGVTAVWLTASSDLIAARVHAMSRYDELSADHRWLVNRFLARTVCYDEIMRDAVRRLGLPLVAVEPYQSPEDVATLVVACSS
jgi:2-phosphoglycerate kinase